MNRLIGHSPAMKELWESIATAAESTFTVLIQGESGTGKELAARAVHDGGGRRGRFVAINCGAMPEGLLESELFGYEKGAFTGADAMKKGLFEAASEGTVFLDEIGECSPALQVKLLRVIQQREIRRLGGADDIRVDVRIICATNRNLLAAVADGTFREDLYYRLSVIEIRTPTLRERPEDIPELARHFIGMYGARINGILDDALDKLRDYNWPGNVRQLEHAIQRAIAYCKGKTLSANDVRYPGLAALPTRSFYPQVENYERALLADALRDTNGRPSRAARLLGLNPKNFNRMLRNHGLDEPPEDQESR